ncbi:hypothetical protein NQT62_14195 [Limnobacter humi]|uniref:Putative Flp pilus-assembly TadG-like N-terminal domain-containing protein n=1 Tax=Limnobacter humi TaxID=1778671 RepID=A0ABT1WJB2_9BURK|nr:pilus assembly protein TadG-related protein [Limnobacter humi]MCQ8897589.1 hypothetical protein [Limnobacter humi]
MHAFETRLNRNRHVRHQSGATYLLALFILGMTIAAFGVFGVGQVVWEREEVQRIADLTAKVAASQIDDAANGFQAARDYASKNGLKAGSDQITINCVVKGTNSALSAGSCQQSVLVTVTRTVPAAFLTNKPVKAIAEATVTPFISGIVGTNLLALNTQGSALSPLFSALGTRLNLNAVGFQQLLTSDAQIDLLQLGTKLNVFQAGDTLNLDTLLNANVTAAKVLKAALNVAGNGAPNVSIPNGGELNNVTFQMSKILTGPSTAVAGDLTGATVSLGNIAYTTALAAATGIPAGVIQVNMGTLLRISVLSPPQMFVAKKSLNSGAVLASAKTEQISVSTSINNLMDLTATSGGGRVDVKGIECRLPQSDSATLADLYSTPLTASLSIPTVANVNTSLASGSASNVEFAGYPDPTVSGSYSFEAQKGLNTLSTNLTANVLGLNLPILLINNPLKAALNVVGSTLDTALDVIGLDVNRVTVQINGMDCFSTAVLTR